MKNALLLPALLCPLFSLAQSAAPADFFVVSDSSFAFFRTAPGKELSAYSAPGGGRLIRQGRSVATPVKWSFAREKQPSFLMVRDEKAGAKVFPLEQPLFKITDVAKNPENALFHCNAVVRTGENIVAELWLLGEKGWQKNVSKMLEESPSWLRFETGLRAGVEAAQVRFVSGSTLYHTESLFGDAAAESFFTIFPNPAPGRFTVSTGSAGKLLVTDITGRLVYSTSIATGESLIHLPNTSPGSYLLQFISAEMGKVSRASVQVVSE